nr:uncharacterized protein LOC127313226 isoform X1 [Lolium perenne]
MIRTRRPTRRCTSSTRCSRSPLSTGLAPPVLCSAPRSNATRPHNKLQLKTCAKIFYLLLWNCKLFIRTEPNPVAKIYCRAGLINGDYFQLIEENERWWDGWYVRSNPAVLSPAIQLQAATCSDVETLLTAG